MLDLRIEKILGIELGSGCLLAAVRQGLAVGAVKNFAKTMDVPLSELAPLLDESPRTIRRYQKLERSLPVRASDKLILFARALIRAEDHFGNRESAVEWLKSVNPLLGFASPLSYFDTTIGVQLVLDEIDRLEEHTDS